MTQLLLGLLLFLGMHSISIVAPAARDRWAAALGKNGWRALYVLPSLLGFVLLIRGYGEARLAPVTLYMPPAGLRHVSFLLMLPVFPLLFATYLPGRIKSAARHPTLLAVMVWSFAHLLANGMLADVLLFGGFLLWAVADRRSFNRRVERLLDTAPPSRWNDPIAVIAGLAAYASMLFWLHARFIGVPLL